MKRFHAGRWIALCAAILLLAGAACLWLWNAPGGDLVEIERNGEVLYRFRLSDIQDAQTIEIARPDGSNTVVVENGEIRVSAADCPDQTCVQMGPLRSRAVPIVCLPHELIIRFAEETGDGLDALAQ